MAPTTDGSHPPAVRGIAGTVRPAVHSGRRGSGFDMAARPGSVSSGSAGLVVGTGTGLLLLGYAGAALLRARLSAR
ncbi:hypothetical protein EFE23_17065 [Micromonospora solifontis]|uniref:Uncharacterized protein n=1 Tax=Micromonospora solifontis TaxID=2487138 RepID=A0ABX9WFS2_9ACTN|nr:hypothetical protein EFE23_17065 [Micromonospora solifontis]